MPILNAVLQGEATDKQGNKKRLAPADALVLQGPIVQVRLSATPNVRQPILSAGGTLPNPVAGMALIDTGAAVSCIDDDVAIALKLPVTGTGFMTSATHTGQPRNLYPVEIEIAGWPIKFGSNRIMGANLKPQQLVALIGRDLLKNCVLVYNGPTGGFSLSI